MMTFSTDIDSTEWQQLVERSPVTCFFQTPECYAFYNSLSFLKPFLYSVSENKKLVGVMCGYLIADGNLLKQYFSRRAIIPGGLLLDTDISSEALQKLLQEASKELRKKAIYIEIRNYNYYGTYKTIIESTGFNYVAHNNIHIPISNLESTLSGMNDSKRRQLKTAQRAGVTWNETTNQNDILAFYECLSHIYKTKVKTSLFPLEFFQKLVGLKNAKLLVVKHNDKVIGGMACVLLPNNALYEWFVCGDENVEKAYYPSVVATWAGMECAVQNHLPRFDFMGAGKPDNDYGVREFKRKFGGELVEHGRFLYICKPKLYALGKWVVNKMKSLKI